MYRAEIIKNIDHGQSCWETQDIGIYDQSGILVGKFHRNYPSFGVETFAPFRRGSDWFALCSSHYVALDVISLPDCKYLGGEDQDDPCGFCPVEVYIPRYQIIKHEKTPSEELHEYPEQNHSWLSLDRYEREYDEECWEPNREIFYDTIVFVSGCVWGDDSGNWKIEVRDISEAHKGIIKTLPAWEYWEIAGKLSLREAIKLSAFNTYDPGDFPSLNVNMAINKIVRLNRDKENQSLIVKEF